MSRFIFKHCFHYAWRLSGVGLVWVEELVDIQHAPDVRPDPTVKPQNHEPTATNLVSKDSVMAGMATGTGNMLLPSPNTMSGISLNPT